MISNLAPRGNQPVPALFSSGPLCQLRRPCVGLLLLAMVFGLVAPAEAQRQQLPQVQYYTGFGVYYDADYKDAERFFRRGTQTTFKFGTRRFLDSVCYWTMLGECYYHMGNYAQAIQMYEQSLELYLTYQSENWQARIQLPPVIQPNNTAVARARINWAVSNRTGKIANVPNTYQVLFGRLDADRVLNEGGVVQNAEIKQVDLNEIMRCLALCLHRRRAIKGPTARMDPLSPRLVAAMSSVPVGNGTVIGAYNGVLLGIAQATMEDWSAATSTLKRALQFSGMDHPLTPVALMELANIGVASGNESVAQQLALEASISAAIFDQFDLVEEALALGTMLHLKSTRSAYPPLANAIPWARANRARLLQASAIVRLAECLAEAGDPAGSTKVLSQVGGVINRRNTLGQAVVSARLKYVTALNQFSTANFSAGMNGLAAALKHFQTGSLWLYRLGLADGLATSGKINVRQADQLYSVLLRDPVDLDWQLDPLEAIAFLATPHVGAMERWFEIVVARRDYRRALDISELVRRHRFFSTLPLGGRLMGFRWVMMAPEEALSDVALKQRAEFLNRNVAFRKSVEQSKQVIKQLRALPIKPEFQSEEDRQQGALLKQLSGLSTTQEAILASNALRREPSILAFPPQRELGELQSAIAGNQFALVSLATSSGYHLFLVNKDTVQYVSFSRARDVVRSVGKWLKELGVNEVAVDVSALAEEDWKESAKQLTGQFFPNTKPADWAPFRELVIIPDGVLWYVPFEALLVGEDEEQKFLSELVNVRYSPTLGLAFGAQRPTREIKTTAVVVARMHPRGDAELADRQFDELAKQIPDAVKLDQIGSSTNLLAGMMDQAVVWSGTKLLKGNFYQFAPLQLGTEKKDGSLAAWMSLPWEGPEHLIVPGYQSEGLMLRGKTPGADLFATTTALLASGTRSILISRWNTGGKTSLQLTQNYTQKMKTEGIAKAIAESRQLVRETELDFENEPRLRSKKTDPATQGSHPLLWASHLLVAIPDQTAADFNPNVDPGDSDDLPDQDNAANPKDPQMKEDDGKEDDGKEDDGKEDDGKEDDGKEDDGKVDRDDDNLSSNVSNRHRPLSDGTLSSFSCGA